MNEPIRQLQSLGQRLWLDSISRPLLQSGSLERCVAESSVTGLTCSQAIFEQGSGTHAYDDSIRVLHAAGFAGEELFFELALEDLARAAGLLRPTFDASEGVDGWVSLGVSPLLANNTAHTIRAASKLHERAATPNLFIQIPGTPEGARAVEELIFDGVPVNVGLLFSSEHYLAAAGAYLRGIERRLAAGLHPKIASVASMFVSPWDVSVKEEISPPFRNRLGIAMAMLTYRAHRELLASERWQRLAEAGASPQRLLWTSTGTGTTDPEASDTLYVESLIAPDTINALSEKTLQAFADHGQVGAALPADGDHADAVLEEFRREGVDDDALAQQLQRDGVEALAISWHAMLSRISEKSAP